MQGSILAGLRSSRITNSSEPNSFARCRRRLRWRYVIALAIGLALLSWILIARWKDIDFEWSDFASSFLQLDWRWALGSMALSILTYYGRALRWRVMLLPLVGPSSSRWRLFSATAIGFTAVVLLGRPGEFVRPYLIAVREKVSVTSQLAAWFLERICDLLAVLLVFGFALTQIDPERVHVGPALRWVFEIGGWALGGLGALCVVILVMLSRFSDTMRRRLLDALRFLPQAYQRRLERAVTSFLHGAAATKTQSSLIWLFLYTVLEWALIVLCFCFLLRAFPATAGMSLRDVMIFMGFIAFGSIIQIPGVGGGIQIVSILVLTELYGLSVEQATSVAVMIWAVTFVVIVPIGLSLAFREGLNWKRLRQLEKDAAAQACANGDNSNGVNGQ